MTTAHLFEVGPGDVALTSDDWYTPPWLFKAAGLVFDLDVCAPVDYRQRTSGALRYYTAIHDGLTQPWEGLVWMNPPWSKSLPWVERFAQHQDGLALLPATRSRATALLLECASSVTFFTGQFIRPNGDVDHNPWLILLAARGPRAVGGLQRVAAARGVPAWVNWTAEPKIG